MVPHFAREEPKIQRCGEIRPNLPSTSQLLTARLVGQTLERMLVSPAHLEACLPTTTFRNPKSWLQGFQWHLQSYMSCHHPALSEPC